MPPKTKVRSTYNNLSNKICSSQNLYTALLPFATNYDVDQALKPSQAKQAIAAAFLVVVSGWERYVEAMIIRYLTGARYVNRQNGAIIEVERSPQLLVSQCVSLSHAYQELTGLTQYNPDINFVSNLVHPKDIRKKARKLFVNGEPFIDAINKYSDMINTGIVIRNRIAHSSSKCVATFNAEAKLLMEAMKLPRGFMVGDLLLSPTGKGTPKTFKGGTIFESFMIMYQDLADEIAGFGKRAKPVFRLISDLR